MEVKKISLAHDFSRFPGGRLSVNGPHSGEEFREKFLLPALAEFARVEIDLNGVAGLPSSFLEEAFGGAVAKLGYKSVVGRLSFSVSDDPFVKEEILRYMKRAAGI